MARRDKARTKRYAKKAAVATNEAQAKRQERQQHFHHLLDGSALGCDHHASAEEKLAIVNLILEAGGCARKANLLVDLYNDHHYHSTEQSNTFKAAVPGKDCKLTGHHLNLSREKNSDNMVFGPVPDREYHEGFMRKAIEMAEMALRSDETPVGCVFVHKGEIIGRGINGTNATLNVRSSPLTMLTRMRC